MFTWICHRWFFEWQTSRVLSKLLHNVDRFILHFIRHVRVSIVIEILLCPSRSGNSFILAPFSRRVAWVCRKEWKLNERGVHSRFSISFHYTLNDQFHASPNPWTERLLLLSLLNKNNRHDCADIYMGLCLRSFEYGWEMALGAKRYFFGNLIDGFVRK